MPSIAVYDDERVLEFMECQRGIQLPWKASGQSEGPKIIISEINVHDVLLHPLVVSPADFSMKGHHNQRWILEMASLSYADLRSVIRETSRYMIRNRGNSRVIWLNAGDLIDYPYDDGDLALYVGVSMHSNVRT